MKPIFKLGRLQSIQLVCVFVLGIQTLSFAQLTIHNNTSCTIYAQASQVDNSSSQDCTPCNVSSITTIPAGGTWIHPGDASCGHFRWLAVRWHTQVGGVSGISYNPIWQGGCGQSTLGGRCDGRFTYARWNVPSSPGPATVVINEP
ncbi:MAG: hypothetical protein AAF990_25665 [Bacteroidota bacterium]